MSPKCGNIKNVGPYSGGLLTASPVVFICDFMWTAMLNTSGFCRETFFDKQQEGRALRLQQKSRPHIIL